MAPRSGNRRSRYDDPYTFDDPYIHSPPSAHNGPAYEYIGTDEPQSPRFDNPPRHTFSPNNDRPRRPSPTRRQSRTTSPPRPRRSRHDRTYTPPPRTSRHSSPPRSRDIDRDVPRDSKKPSKGKHHRYHDFAAHNPKLQSYGKKGLNLISEAAAAYAAAQAGKEVAEEEPHRSRSVDRGDHRDRSRRHHRRYSPSPSPSPSPAPRHRRRHSTHHGDRDRDHSRYSRSPPPLSRDPDSYLASRHDSDRSRDRGRERRHRHRRRHHSPSPSPSPSPAPSRRSRSFSFLPGRRNSTVPPPSQAVADKWQMAARAALEAGSLTAFRLRKEPGSWTGNKAAKVATAALGAAAMDAFMDNDPRGAGGRGMKGMAENAISSLIASQIVGKAGKKGRGRR